MIPKKIWWYLILLLFFYNRIPSLLSIYSLILPSPFSYSLSFHFPKLSLNHNTSALKPNQNQPCFKWLRCLLIKIMCEMETFTKFEKNSGFFWAFTKKKFHSTKIEMGKVKKILDIAFAFGNTGSPRYMRSFYLQFCVYAIQKWPLFWNLSSDLQ